MFSSCKALIGAKKHFFQKNFSKSRVLSGQRDSTFLIIKSSKEKQQEENNMSDKIYRFIASLFLLFEDDLEGDFPDDAYVLEQRAKEQKIHLAPRKATEPIQIPHAG